MTDPMPLAVVPRPGRRPYRARKPPTAHVFDDNAYSTPGVIVMRTHDIERATELANKAWRHFGDPRDKLVNPKCLWARLIPWDPMGYGDSSFQYVQPNERNAVPCVAFEAEESPLVLTHSIKD